MTTGVLTVDRVYGEYSSVNGFSTYSAWAFAPGSVNIQKVPSYAVADYLKYFDGNTNTSGMPDFSITSRGGADNIFGIRFDSSYTSKEDYNAYLAQHPLHVCLKLATPQTYQLTPVEVSTLLGTNNIYADTGDVEVQYRADTRLFCDKNAPKVSDVRVNGTSVLADGVANVPMGSNSDLGVFKTGSDYGIGRTNDGILQISVPADSSVKSGTNTAMAITVSKQHMATFYGLAKAAGADMASLSSVTLGQYPDAQKKAIREMLGIPNMQSEVIRDYTTTEDLVRLTIDVDENGQSFELRTAKIYVPIFFLLLFLQRERTMLTNGLIFQH